MAKDKKNKDGGENDKNEKEFFFGPMVDIHVTGHNKISNIVYLANEHGFRGIVVDPNAVSNTSFCIRNQNLDSAPTELCIANMLSPEDSIDVKIYSMLAAKEKGANEIEMPLSNNIVDSGDMKNIEEEVAAISSKAQKIPIAVKYKLNYGKTTKTIAFTNKFAKILKENNCPFFSTYIPEKMEDEMSSVLLWIRDIKRNACCATKVHLESPTIELISMFKKAGVDIIGMDWKNSPFLCHGYENLVQK